MSLIGLHVSNILDIELKINKNINFFQIFVSLTADYGGDRYMTVLANIKKNKIYLLVHGSYSINLAKRWKSSDWWILQFINEIQIASQLNAFGIITHTGKRMELSVSETLNNMYTALLYIHSQTAKYQNVRIILETPSGQGTETLTKIEDFCKFMNKFYTHPDPMIRDRFGICIDTCHIFAAGHDIREKENMNVFFGTINGLVGIDKIKVCHVNDSKKGLGANLDRHMNIGRGEIGKESMIQIVQFMKDLEIPMVLETPFPGIYDDYKMLTNQ
jgi:apurinic endonuclease APN1